MVNSLSVIARAVRRELRRRVVERRLAQPHVGAVDGARREMHQVHRVAGEQRQLEHAALVDHLAERRFGRIQQRRIGRHFDDFFRIADLQSEVELHLVRHTDLHIILHQLLKAGELGGHVVPARNQVREKVVAIIVCRSSQRNPGFGIDRFHDCPGDGRTGWIGNAAQNGAADFAHTWQLRSKAASPPTRARRKFIRQTSKAEKAGESLSLACCYCIETVMSRGPLS